VTAKLIVNADDYGMTEGVSLGIRQSHLNGIVTTTTAMMNQPYTLEALAVGREQTPGLGFGVHLVLTAGAPVRPADKVPSLVRRDGRFRSLGQMDEAIGGVDPVELKDEWRAQIETFLQTGLPLDHIDSHHHIAAVYEKTLPVLFELAAEYDTPIRHPYAGCGMHGGVASGNPMALTIRDAADALMTAAPVRTTDHLDCAFYDDGATLDKLLSFIDSLEDGTSAELMCHPGIADAELLRISAYNRPREREVALLTDPCVKARIAERGVQLVTFAGL
jgi:predicted glycoside hydrolase/deacetylase ChbG (UPF0249 family)